MHISWSVVIIWYVLGFYFYLKFDKENKMKIRKRRLLAVAAAALLLTGCAMGEASGEKTVQGISALEEGSYSEAQGLFEDAIRENEDQMLAYRGLGLAYMGQARYEEAQEAFETALEQAEEKQPENRQDIRLYLASVLYRQGDYEKTIDVCTEILEAEPKGVADACYLRGAGYLHEGSQDDAKKDFDRAVTLQPEDYDLYLNIYETYRDMSLSGIGGEYLQKALDIQGEELEDYYNRGRIYYYLEDYEEAQSQLIGPVEQKYEPAMNLIGRVYIAQGDYDHARNVYEQIQTEYGESVSSYNGLALCAMESGNYDEALGYIGQGLALEGTEGKQELYFNEIVAYERKLDFEAAKEKAEAYVASYPADEAGRKELTFLDSR